MTLSFKFLQRGKKQETVPQKKSPFEIGEKGAVEEMIAAVSENFFDERILYGAVKAFKEGKPENLQAFFAADLSPKTPSFHSRNLAKRGDSVLLSHDSGYFLARIVYDLSSDQIQQALEKMTPEKKQIALDSALYVVADAWTASNNVPGDILKLVTAGANVNAHNGLALLSAAKENNMKVVKSLHGLGEDFSISIQRAETSFHFVSPDKQVIGTLKLYQDMILGAAREKDLQKQVDDLKAQLAKKNQTPPPPSM
ncbi:MAG: hypothetical protein K8R48_07615 [Alphaproteobacteria bacterium]|nr:hypothetical protein [Alphaproteobacteria bacterium]